MTLPRSARPMPNSACRAPCATPAPSSALTPTFCNRKPSNCCRRAGVVLELILAGVPDAALLKRCQDLRERGYTLALSDYRGIDDRSRPLLPLVKVIKIDLGTTDEAQLQELAGSLRKLPIRLLAEGVGSREQMLRCHHLGFELFQGRYFARAEMVSGRRLSASQAALIRLINLVGRDVETPASSRMPSSTSRR
jgi:c-di-GMP-related signal transduction protein